MHKIGPILQSKWAEIPSIPRPFPFSRTPSASPLKFRRPAPDAGHLLCILPKYIQNHHVYIGIQRTANPREVQHENKNSKQVYAYELDAYSVHTFNRINGVRRLSSVLKYSHRGLLHDPPLAIIWLNLNKRLCSFARFLLWANIRGPGAPI